MIMQERWLLRFLSGDYFSPCARHTSSRSSERNHFCIDCGDGPVCSMGLREEHDGHQSLQVRRASHMDAVRVADICTAGVDISHIQTYSINGARIVFLLSRPLDRIARGALHWCASCNRTLNDSSSTFCSIACKLLVSTAATGASLPMQQQQQQHLRKNGSSRTCYFDGDKEQQLLVMKKSTMVAKQLTHEQRMSKAGRKLSPTSAAAACLAPSPKRKKLRIDTSQHVEDDNGSSSSIVAAGGSDPSSPTSVLFLAAAAATSTIGKCSEQRARQRKGSTPQRSPLA